MRTIVSALVLALLVLARATPATAAPVEDPIENARLPRLWHVVSRTQATDAQLKPIGAKLGVALASLESVAIDAGGVRLQVNLARTADEKAAEALRAKFEALHGGRAVFAARRGQDVAEIVCELPAVARKARELLGWDGPGFSISRGCYFRAELTIAPLVRSDGMRWNRLFNLLRSSDDPKVGPAIEEEAKAFVFADRLPDAKPDAPPIERVHGVPRIEVAQEGQLAIFDTSRAYGDVSAWTAATDAWPVDAPEVRAAATAALGDQPPTSPRERAERVLAWVHAHVRYGGDVAGSRYGVRTVMAQGYGHCWDQSDVFVAVCRAAGVPARQVGGWLYGGEGHVWAEVVVGRTKEYAEVLAVDPGTTWLGASEDYIRLWESSDGRTPFVYWSIPKIERLACIK